MIQLTIVSLRCLGQKYASAKELSQQLHIPIKQAFEKVEALVQRKESIYLQVDSDDIDTVQRLEAVGLEIGSIDYLTDPFHFDAQETDETHAYIWTTELKEYILVKGERDKSYSICYLPTKSFCLIESFREHAYVVQKLLENGATTVKDFPS